MTASTDYIGKMTDGVRFSLYDTYTRIARLIHYGFATGTICVRVLPFTTPPGPLRAYNSMVRYVLFFWIMYKIYIFMQCAPILRFKIHILFLRAYA